MWLLTLGKNKHKKPRGNRHRVNFWLRAKWPYVTTLIMHRIYDDDGIVRVTRVRRRSYIRKVFEVTPSKVSRWRRLENSSPLCQLPYDVSINTKALMHSWWDEKILTVVWYALYYSIDYVAPTITWRTKVVRINLLRIIASNHDRDIKCNRTLKLHKKTLPSYLDF